MGGSNDLLTDSFIRLFIDYDDLFADHIKHPFALGNAIGIGGIVFAHAPRRLLERYLPLLVEI